MVILMVFLMFERSLNYKGKDYMSQKTFNLLGEEVARKKLVKTKSTSSIKKDEADKSNAEYA